MPEDPKLKRRYQRIPTPVGIWVAWQHDHNQDVSRVRDLNTGGLFIATSTPAPEGATIQILLSVQEGEIRSEAVVRNVAPAEGMGIEFKDMSQQAAVRLGNLVSRLLRSNRRDESD
jgi:hypothetical protein